MEFVLLDWTRMGRSYCLAGVVGDKGSYHVVRPLLSRYKDAPVRNTGWSAWQIDGHGRWEVFELIAPEPAPPGRVYQLWLLVADRTGPRQLGILPPAGRKRIAVSPGNARLLAGAGELVVTLEPAGGSPNPEPSGPAVFRGALERAG